jgi:hypothetical protein
MRAFFIAKIKVAREVCFFFVWLLLESVHYYLLNATALNMSWQYPAYFLLVI